MSLFGIRAKKSVDTSVEGPSGLRKTSSISVSSVGSSGSVLNLSRIGSCKGKSFANFDEKQDYVKRCRLKKACSGLANSTPASVSFSVGGRL